MKKRAFGLETEYPAACRKRADKKFYSGSPYGVCGADGDAPLEPPGIFLINAMPISEEIPEHIKELLIFPKKADTNYFWLASNGARFYFDLYETRLPEYATPECPNPREALIHSMAGDTVVEDIRKEVLRLKLLERYNDGEYDDIFIFRMNTAFPPEGFPMNSVGCHENYSTLEEFMPPNMGSCDKNNSDPFLSHIVPFFTTRQIFDGAGGIKRDEGDKSWRYVISQRPFFVEKEYSASTVGGSENRGLVHFRGDAHESPPGLTRLHIHCGDLNMSPWGKYVAMCATHLILRAMEEKLFDRFKYRSSPNNLVRNLTAIASDPTLKAKIKVYRGSSEVELTALDMQRECVNAVVRSITDFSPEEKGMLALWKNMIAKLERDPMEAGEELDWLIKENYLNERHGGDFANNKTRFASVLYHDISERGIYNRLLRGGAVKPFASQEEVMLRRLSPPETRAKFRSRYLKLLLKVNDGVDHSYSKWEFFNGTVPDSAVTLRDPLAPTTEQGEWLLRDLEKLIERQNRDSGS